MHTTGSSMKTPKNHTTLKSDFVIKRFNQLLLGTLALTIVSLASLLAQSNGEWTLATVIIAGMVGIILSSVILISKGKEELGRAIFLFSTAMSVVGVAWLHGGLRDSSILSFPIIIVFTAMLATRRVFFAITVFLVSAALLLGANMIYGWFPRPLPPMSWVYILDAAMILTLTAFVALTVRRDMYSTMSDLTLENEKVIESRETIQSMVERDTLTGLYNRHASELYYHKLLTSVIEQEEKIILFFLDLDNFKNINDSFGHNAGDDLLIGIANALNQLTKANDAACRLGGDEFVLIIKRPHSFDIDAFAAKTLQVITTPYEIADTDIRMTGSVGIAIAPDDGTSFDELRKKADIAMYKSKQLGKNTYSYYSAQLHEETARRHSILDGLKNAVDKQLLELHIQPKVNLTTGRIDSAEALLRWTRDNPHQFMPDDFIPVIESTEMIHDIGQWCIEEACLACKRWHDAGLKDLSIAVNVSSVQLMRNNFTSLVFNALQQSGLPAKYLEIELTENVLLKLNQSVKSQLTALKEMGVQLSIDDFGTGYSNLSYLINLKVDTIKLDKTFIEKISTSQDYHAVVKAVIHMAQILGLNVVAEGVESNAVKRILKDLNCDYAQGYLWSKALPEAAFLRTVMQLNQAAKSPMLVQAV